MSSLVAVVVVSATSLVCLTACIIAGHDGVLVTAMCGVNGAALAVIVGLNKLTGKGVQDGKEEDC